MWLDGEFNHFLNYIQMQSDFHKKATENLPLHNGMDKAYQHILNFLCQGNMEKDAVLEEINYCQSYWSRRIKQPSVLPGTSEYELCSGVINAYESMYKVLGIKTVSSDKDLDGILAQPSSAVSKSLSDTIYGLSFSSEHSLKEIVPADLAKQFSSLNQSYDAALLEQLRRNGML